MRIVYLSIVLLCGFNTVTYADWTDLWSTPEQRAADAFEAGDYESLLYNAPDNNWTGLGQFQAGDFEAASNTFSEQAINEQMKGDSDAVNRALYNQGVSDVMAGHYEEALSNFDTVLSDDPEFVDAAHNREIAQKLIEQQQQGDQGDQSDEGEQSQENGDQQENQQESQEGQQSDESSQSDEQTEGQQESEQNSEQSAGSEGDKEDASDSESETDAQQAASDARKALAAEAQQGEEKEGADAEQSETMGAAVEERPLSESEQATEQWLRRIPDDPTGLLRRKLEQSHRNEFPEVRDAVNPW